LMKKPAMAYMGEYEEEPEEEEMMEEMVEELDEEEEEEAQEAREAVVMKKPARKPVIMKRPVARAFFEMEVPEEEDDYMDEEEEVADFAPVPVQKKAIFKRRPVVRKKAAFRKPVEREPAPRKMLPRKTLRKPRPRSALPDLNMDGGIVVEASRRFQTIQPQPEDDFDGAEGDEDGYDDEYEGARGGIEEFAVQKRPAMMKKIIARR